MEFALIELPSFSYNSENLYGIHKVDELDIDGKEKLPNNLKAVLSDYIVAEDIDDYWTEMGKSVVEIIKPMFKKVGCNIEFSESYRNKIYVLIDSIEPLKKFVEDETKDERIFKKATSKILKENDFNYEDAFQKATHSKNVLKCLRVDLETFIEDYELEFTPEITDINELQYYVTDDEEHYRWIKDAPGQQKLNLKYESISKLNEALEEIIKGL